MAKRGAHKAVADQELEALSDEDIRERWRRFMVEIRNQIWLLQLDAYLYQGVLAMAQVNHEIEGQIFTLRLEENFYIVQLIALRRLADTDKDVVSFQTLFHQVLYLMDQRPPILTRAAFVDQYDKKHYRRPSRPSQASEKFDNLVGPEIESLSKKDVGDDRARLTQAYQRVSRFTNLVVSHYGAATMIQLRPEQTANPSSYIYPTLPPYADLANALSCLEDLLKKYWELLYANNDWKFPVIASNIWGLFKKPWITNQKPNMPTSPDTVRRQK